MGLLAALKEIGAQLLGFKFLFTIFQERTRAYYLHQGLTLGSARYIATGRGYTMSSNFVKLFAWYGCALALLLRPRSALYDTQLLRLHLVGRAPLDCGLFLCAAPREHLAGATGRALHVVLAVDLQPALLPGDTYYGNAY